jgi:hypothetical protein
MRLAIVLALLFVLCTPVMVRAELGLDGTDPAAVSPHDNPGDPCGSCPDQYSNSWGTTFKDGYLYLLDRNSHAVVQMDLVTCQVLGATPFNGIGTPCGLGYDNVRDMWIIDDPGADYMYVVDMGGNVVNSWPTTTSGNDGPVGCAYDANRDVYWSCSWTTSTLHCYDPTSGAPGGVLNCPAGTRISGCGYDACNDVLTYNGRDQAYAYWVDAGSGALLAQAPIPMGGNNNGRGSSSQPGTSNAWITHNEQPNVYCLEGMGMSPIENVTWGQIKDVFK